MIVYYFLKLLVQYFLFLYITSILFLYFFQIKLIYKPDNKKKDKSRYPSIPEGTENVIIPSKYPLHAFYLRQDSSFFTILFLHGNSGLLEDRIYKLKEFKKLSVNVLMISYRGFQGNKGNPTECGLYEDAFASKNWLIQNGTDPSHIVLYGESLGTAVAVHTAACSPPFAGVILESPFTSMEDMANLSYRIFFPKLFLQDRFATIYKIDKISCPILIMHGENDKLVPFTMGKSVFDGAKYPKFFYQNDDGHMMQFGNDVMNVIQKFLSIIESRPSMMVA